MERDIKSTTIQKHDKIKDKRGANREMKHKLAMMVMIFSINFSLNKILIKAKQDYHIYVPSLFFW